MADDLLPIDVLRRYPAHAPTLNSLLDSRVAAGAQREFLWYQGQGTSYGELAQQVARAAAMLQARGVRKGDRVAVMSTNHPATVQLFLGLAWLGAVMVGVNPEYGVPEARYVLEHAQVCGVVCSPEAFAVAAQAAAGMQPRPWFLLNEADAQAGEPAFADALRDARGAPPPARADDPDATCVFVYTSGTTGSPKGVMHSQRNIVLAGEGFVERMYLQPDERLLCVLPMFHVNAICYSFAGSLACGGTLVLEPRFSASRFWPVAVQSRATEVNSLAASTAILMRRPRSEFVPQHRLRKMYGGPFSPEVYRVWQQEFKVPVLIEGYGMSEIPGALNNPYPGPHKIGSMGKPSRHPDHAMAFTEIRVVGDDGHPLPDGQTGELQVRTPIVMRGYWHDPEQTRAAFRDGGWFATGDLGRRDEDGYIWFVARQKDIIRRRGENISGAELDQVIGSHPLVLHCAAIAVPAELGDDEVMAVVVPRPGAELSAQDIARWCRERLAAFKVPRYVVFRSELPMTPTHRVAKYRLKAEAQVLIGEAVDLQAA